MYGLILENIADYIRRQHGAQVWQEVQYVAGLSEGAFDSHSNFPEESELLTEMYGLILENIADYVRKHHGAQTWQEAQYVAGLTDGAFENHNEYDESIATRIVWATQDVTGIDLDTIMREIGHTFLDFIAQYEYDKILRVLGRTFTEFLNGLDNLHEYLRFSYPQMRPPSFYCEHESKSGLTLHYRSKRPGFVSYVQGQLVNLGKTLFDTEVEIEILDKETDEHQSQHVIMRLHFNNVDYRKMAASEVDEDMVNSIVQVTSDMLFDIFPFIIVFNRGMRIRNVGMGLTRIMENLVGEKINVKFVLIRPVVSLKWEEIMLHTNNQFELMSVKPVFSDGEQIKISADLKEVEQERRRMEMEDKMKFLTLKGQMMYMEEWESICFLAVPIMENLDQMYKTGLFINDFALHDSSRDLVLAATQQKAEVQLLIDQEAKKSERLEESMQRLDAEKERTDQILYQLLPKSVAEKMRAGMDPLTCCESFENVTIMFTDIVGFTTLCNGAEPLAVVRLLNMLFEGFDALAEKHGVVKIETIGDAYEVVGGAPGRGKFHAELVCDCGISFLDCVNETVEEGSGKRARIRMGIHSGPAIAGVVGLKMPKYCMFGETVLVAAEMESTGQPMKIQVSETTKKTIEAITPNVYKFVSYAYFPLRDGGQMKTFWLENRNGPPRDAKEDVKVLV